MKKFLVLLTSAALMLSTAAVSMGAATVAGDFRYDMFAEEGAADESYAATDLRIRVSGDLSETVSATANFQFVRATNGIYPGFWDGAAHKETTNINTKLDEFFVTHKQSWGFVKAGYYEYKFTPSRVLLKSGNYHVWYKADALIAATVNLSEGLSADVMFQPYANASADDGAYGVSLAYNTENWGAKVTFADFKADRDLTAFDVYYKLNDDMKVFVDAVDYSANNGGKYDGLDPVLGFAWSNIAGTKLFGAFEYAINPRFEDQAGEFNEYTLNLKYAFNNKVGLEFEHYVTGDSQTKDMLRVRYQF